MAGGDDLEKDWESDEIELTESGYLMKHNDEKISMRATKDWDVHGNSGCVGLVQAYTKVSLTTQKKQDKYT